MNSIFSKRIVNNNYNKRSEYKVSNEVLGEGAFSKVFAATHLESKNKVALKVVKLKNVHPNFINFCFNEVKLLKSIESKNVIKLCDSWVSNNILFVATEFIDNYDLDVKIKIMRDRGTIYSERTIWYIFYQICAGIKDLHENRILHRDVKPSNIFVTTKYQVKIGDLGLSHRLRDDEKAVHTYVGTEYYMAPECVNKRGYTFPADIWSLGCLLYELCTLRSPFNGDKSNVYSLHKKISNADIIPLPMNLYSEHLVYFIYACLNPEANQRPTAEECSQAANTMFLKFERMCAAFKAANSE